MTSLRVSPTRRDGLDNDLARAAEQVCVCACELVDNARHGPIPGARLFIQKHTHSSGPEPHLQWFSTDPDAS